MFTGIIEGLGLLEDIRREGKNFHFVISSDISKELKVDQSVAHNGCCLTVVECDYSTHTVTAIDETIQKTNLGAWEIGEKINLERAMMPNARLDGHMVQGHVDQIAACVSKKENDGSWEFRFEFEPRPEFVLVEKGSITVNGTSLTLLDVADDAFSVAIIPYTFEHTNFKNMEIGDTINLEFDVIGKYVAKMMQHYLVKK